MKLVIDIPEAFEGHFNQDRFKDSFERVINDSFTNNYGLAGNYERETLEMLITAFENSTPLDSIIADIEAARDKDKLCEYPYNRCINIIKKAVDDES